MSPSPARPRPRFEERSVGGSASFPACATFTRTSGSVTFKRHYRFPSDTPSSASRRADTQSNGQGT